MPDELDIHRASDAERIAIYRNVHEFWGRGLSLEEHVERRLNSVQHNYAHWFAGCLGDTVVASLGCYPVEFQLHGKVHSGIAIGAVHTVPEVRGRGFAPQLIRWVEEFHREQGVAISMLYSDIKPGYYAKQGYIECPSHEGQIDVKTVANILPDESLHLTPFPAMDSLEDIHRAYESFQATRTLSVHRSQDYEIYLIQKSPTDWFFKFQQPDGKSCGYVRLRESEDQNNHWTIRDFILTTQNSELLVPAFSALIRAASENGITSISGWLPRKAELAPFVEITPRGQEITMLKSLSDEILLDVESLASADDFQEIDHV
jgi:predicted N-acetyltransferase YhbS